MNFFSLFIMVSLATTPDAQAAVSGAQAPPAAVPNDYQDDACVSCHQNLPGRLSEVVLEWTQSVHFAHKVTCAGCHGGDPGVKPQEFDNEEAYKNRSHLRRDSEFLLLSRDDSLFTSSARGRSVSYFCGKCHALIKEKHLGSPHGDLGSPTCLFCHGEGSHAIQISKVDIIDPRPRAEGGKCAACHRAATMETVALIKNVLVNTEKQLSDATEQYAWLSEHGYKNLALEKMYYHSRETLSQLRQTFHSFNMREINNFASAIKDNSELTAQTFEMIEGLQQAKQRQAKIGIASVVFLLAFAALLLYYRKAVLYR